MRKNILNISSKEKELLMRLINSSEAELKKLKVKVILLRNEGTPIKDIIKDTGLSKRTIINYTNMYKKNPRFFHQKPKRLKSILQEISTLPNIYIVIIINEYGIYLSITQVRNYLIRNHIYSEHTKAPIKELDKRRIKKAAKELKDKIANNEKIDYKYIEPEIEDEFKYYDDEDINMMY